MGIFFGGIEDNERWENNIVLEPKENIKTIKPDMFEFDMALYKYYIGKIKNK